MCGWNNHRMLLWCNGFIQLLLAASMSLPGHSGSSALLWALEFRWYGRNTVLHPRSSRILPLTLDTPPLLQTLSFFSPQGTRDLSKLCANQPVRCGAHVDGTTGRHSGSGLAGRQVAGRAPPVPLIW